MHRHSETSMCALKLLFFQEFWSQTAAMCCVRLEPATMPARIEIPAGRHGAWRSLVAHLLWEQRVGGSNPSAPTTCMIAMATSGHAKCVKTSTYRCLE